MTNKKFWIVFIIVAIAMVACTVYFAANKEPIVVEKFAEPSIDNSEAIDETHLLVSGPKETYRNNPIEITYYRNDDGIVSVDDGVMGITAERFTARYIQISGLKNKDVENKINNDILINNHKASLRILNIVKVK